ncbi:Ankyrin repeat protein (plasmid) [Legionella adelaidensis]|uniref:Ankyrin repeat protein n=1 Tax=Legionella adelaidensis TaxID=45056 RepID=A0A0W0R2J3_9GAMM|nr:hypothetical protein [Legionella adelaidensis]KTC65302.1 hypothetical protein Lade_1324 [Legionella adelaidensis]VEH86048.1 Ankyrin repeat protein [Legionella adelaidensis]
MPSPSSTAALQQLLSTESTSLNFKQTAMDLARQGADITVQGHDDSEPTLLHILTRNNDNGVNNAEIAELVDLNPAVLTAKDGRNLTAWQALLDDYTKHPCFDNFKPSAMTLARKGADITVRAQAGSGPTVLHVLLKENNNGVNNDEIAELVQLNRAILTAEDGRNTTAWQALLDHYVACYAVNRPGSLFRPLPGNFADFKQSLMTLARLGADLTIQSINLSRPTWLHILAAQNKDGEDNDEETAELIRLNPAILECKDDNGEPLSTYYCCNIAIRL